MIKISISRSDSLDTVKRKLAETSSRSVILSIPPGAELAATHKRLIALANFASQRGVDLYIESVDEAVLTRAEEAGLETIHQFFGASAPVSDIVVPTEEVDVVGEGDTQTEEQDRDDFEEEEPKDNLEDEQPRAMPITTGPRRSSSASAAQHAFFASSPKITSKESRIDYAQSFPEPTKPRLRRFLSITVGVLGPILLLAGGAWATAHFLGKANIAITLKRMPWQKEMVITAVTSGPSEVASDTVPAELFTEKKNLTQLFPGSEEKDISQKARGTITIYNAYSSAPQPLVATTRFVAPDGKIYRLLNAVTVPGAKVDGGKITPSTIVADVVADEAGESYNRDDKAKLSIPGFANSPKAAGFYGEVIAISGGFTGRRKVPTQADLDNAKTKTEEILRSALISAVAAGKPDGFKVLSDSADIQITKLTVNPNSNEEGNFSVFAEGTIRVFGVRESDLKDLFLKTAKAEIAQDEIPDAKLEIASVDYSDMKPNFSNGTLTMTAKIDAALVSTFDATEFQQAVAGLSLDQIRSALAATPAVKEGAVSFWPRWMNNAPKDPARIKVEVK